MTDITKHFDNQDDAYDWLEEVSGLTRHELYVTFGSDELYLEAHYPEGRYTATCGEQEVEYFSGGGDLNGPFTRTQTEWVFSEIDHYPFKTPDYMAPLNELFASFNSIFGGKR
jgi:hypothetical protein